MFQSFVRIAILALLAGVVGCAEEKAGKYEEPEGGYRSLDIPKKTKNGGVPTTLKFSTGASKTGTSPKGKSKTSK